MPSHGPMIMISESKAIIFLYLLFWRAFLSCAYVRVLNQCWVVLIIKQRKKRFKYF